HEVETLSRKPGASRFWDPEKNCLPQEHIAGFDVIINLAGHSLLSGLWTKKQKEKIVQTRVQAERLLCQTIDTLTTKPELFLSASAIGYYGNCYDDIATEESP